MCKIVLNGSQYYPHVLQVQTPGDPAVLLDCPEERERKEEDKTAQQRGWKAG